MSKAIFILFSAVLIASVGTVGSNGQVPYLTVSSKYTSSELGQEKIEVRLHKVPDKHGPIMFLFSADEGITDWTHYIGPGGFILPEDAILVVTDETFIEQECPQEFAGITIYMQAIITETVPTPSGVPFTISRPQSVTFADKYDVEKMNIEPVGIVPHAGKIGDMAEFGEYLYGASCPFDLVRFRLETNGSPELLDVVQGGNFTFTPKHVSANGDRAVLTGENCFVGVVDVSDAKAAPQFVGQFYETDYYFYESVVHSVAGKTYAFVNAKVGGVVAVDVSGKASLGIVDIYKFNDAVKCMGAYNGYLYALTLAGQGYVFDLAKSPDLAQMLVANFTIPDVPRAISFYDKHAFVLSNAGTEVFRVSLPDYYNGKVKPTFVKTLSVGSSETVTGIALGAGNAFLFNSGFLKRFQVDGNLDFIDQESVFLEDSITDVSIESGVVHVSKSGYDRGVDSFKIPGLVPFGEPVYNLRHPLVLDLAVVDRELNGALETFALVVEKNEGMRIVRVTDPKNPELVTTVSGDVRAVTVYENMVVYAVFPNLIRVCEITSTDGGLKEIWAFESKGLAKDLFVEGDYLYVADGLEGLTIFHMVDPQNPDNMFNFNNPPTGLGLVNTVTVSGYFAYLTGLNGVSVVDVSNRKEPELLTDMNLSDYGRKAKHTASDGFNLFVGNSNEGVEVFDTFAPYSDNGVPLVKTFHLPNLASGVAIHGNIAIVSMNYGGSAYSEKYLVCYDVTDPENVYSFETVHDLPYFNSCVKIHNGYIYATDEESLLDILEINQ